MQELEHPGVAAPEPGTRLVHNGENYAVTSISPDGVVIMREDEEGNNSLPEVISLDTYYAEKQAEIDAQEQEQQPQSGENGEAAQETASPAEEEPAPVSGGGAVQEETAPGRIPKDEQGQPLYEQADAETAWDALLEQAGGDEAMAQEVANEIVSEQEKALKAAERKLKKVQDGKPQQRKGDAPLTVEARIAAKQAAREQTSRAQVGVDEARKRLEAWRKIAETSQRRRQAIEAERRQEEQEAARLRGIQEEQERAEREEAERIRREALNGVPDFIEDRPQDARARGYRRVNGNRVDRQEPIQARRGGEVQVKFDDNNIPTGHTALIEASQLQPSHTDGRRNPLHFIDEAQPKERNDEASVMSARKIAANIRPEEITSSVTAYTGAPTVNSRGEVIQGNNRSAALREMWAEHPEQAAKYRQYLADHAADFGLTPEDVEAMQQPVLVNMLDVTDDAAITLGQFVAQDTESGGTERIKPKNMVQKMGDDMRIFAGKLLASADEEMSFAELVDRNGADVLKWMQQKGYITPTQYKSAFDSKGNLTAEAKNDLKGVMYQSIFQNGSTHLEEMFNTLPAKAQKAILATAYRDYDSPNTERMIEEIQDSISAYHALSQDPAFAGARNYKEARIAAEAWKRQYAFDDATGESYLPSERYSNFALLLATMYKGQTQTFIQNTLGHIYDLVQGTQEADLFNQPDNTPRTLVQAINETLGNLREELLLNENFTYNGQRRSNVLAGGSEAGQRGRQGSDGNASSGGRAENGSRQADNSRRTETDSGLSRRDGTQEAGDIRQPAPMDEKARRASIRLNGEQCDILLAQMREQAEVAPDVELNPTTWNERFGENGIIITPLGEVKMGENQIAKFFAKGREKEFGMVAPTLSDPDIIIEKKAPASNAERDTKLLFIKTFIKADGSRYVNFESVTVQKDGMEVSISSHEVDAKVVKKEMQNGNILHLRIELPFSSEWYLTETPTQERPDLVPTSDKKKNVEQNAELPASATTTQDKPFVQTGVNDGSKPADTHSDNQRSGNKDKKTSAETSQERQKTDSNLSEAFKQQMNIRIGQLSKFIQTKDGKLKKKYESLRKTPFFAIFDSGNIYEGPVAIAKTPREALNVAFNYDIGDFDVLYVDFRTKSLDMDLLSIYDVPGFRGDVYDENGAYKDEAKNLLVERISRLGKRQEADGKKRGRKQIEKAIGMLREGLASGDFGTVRRALGMYWTNQYHGAEITEEEAAFVDGVLDNYRQQGIEIINPLGTRYDEGMKVVADFRTDDTLKPGENRIVGVREPQVNTDGVMSHSASIIVAISPVAEESPADVQGNADENIRRAESEVERNPSEAQKEAGNYRKGHVRVDGYDITIEQPKGSVRSGTDADGKRWENVMNNTYGYMRGTEGVDGDHIDVFLSDNPESGNVYVVDQRDPKTGEFDEHKVMYGFGSMEEARDAYLKNYTPGWQGLGTITEVSKEEFRKWIGSSRRKTKPFAEYRSVKKEAGQNEDVRQSRDVSNPLSAEEAAIRDAIVERLRESGIEVITDAEAGQRVLDEANGRGEPVRTQAMLDGLKKASDFILSALGGKTKQRKARIEIPERANRLAEEAIGHPIKSHAININELVHIKKRHGENGTANDANSIPLRDEDIALMPYIMAAPTRVIKGSMAVNGTESVRYEKDLDNGVVVVVEREGRFDVEDMENITMWAKKKPATNVTVAEKASHSTSETIVISETDSAKIRKDAEDAIHGDEKVREHRVYHGSGADFEAFDHSHMGEGEGAQAYGWGSYVTEVEGIGRTYAEGTKKGPYFVYGGKKLSYDQMLEKLSAISGDEELSDDFLYRVEWQGVKNAKDWLKKEELPYYKGLFNVSNGKRFYKERIEAIQKILSEKIRVQHPKSHLYTVEIPDDTGKNYLEWDKPVMKKHFNRIIHELENAGVQADFWTPEHIKGTSLSTKMYYWMKDNYHKSWNTGEAFYNVISVLLGSDKAASEFLSRAGFTGISYPAQATTGGRKDGARNYVIFDEKDLRITDHVRFFRTPGGEAYGFTAGGKIYIDPRVATADTPIHEYAHLWAGALRQANPKEWNNIVELMRGTPAWDEVKRLYPELESDEEIADEALAMYSGRRGAERLREAARRAWNESADLGVKAAAARAMGRVRDALRRFWQNVADLLHFRYTSAEEVADRVMRDLMEGVNPNSRAELSAEERAIEEKAKKDGTWMKAPNGKPTNLTERQWVQVRTRAFKRWFGDWEKTARIEKLKNSKPIAIEYNEEYELNRASAKEWLKKNIRGEYTNSDTGEKIVVSKTGINEVTSHGSQDEVHLKSLSGIPQMIEQAVFIDEIPNTKDHDKYDSYRYYVCGMKIDGEDYTAKIVVGVKGDSKYYDHRLTQIEKGTLIDNLNGLSDSVAENQNASVSMGKDSKLVSILQTNSSKVVDENGEPLVVYRGIVVHEGDEVRFVQTPTRRRDMVSGSGIYLTRDRVVAAQYADEGAYVYQRKSGIYGTYGRWAPYVFEVFVNIRNPLMNNDISNKYSGVAKRKAAGYDGKFQEYDNAIVANSPNQIKSATDNTGAFSAGNDDIRYSRAEEEDANRRFNEELDKWESGGMSANEYVTVGNPIGVLRHFTPDLPIILRQKVLSKSRKKHGLSASDMRNLPAALAEPIFIFKSSDNTIGVLTGLVSDSGENIFVAIELDANKQMGHQMLEVNDILTIHGRETENIINPIKENNTLKWVDKEKGLNWLSSAKSNSQAVTNKALDTATNIVKDFENPSLEDENLFRIGETKRIGGESLFGRRITFTRANPTVTLNAMKRWVLKNADLKEYDVSRTGSRYLSFTHNSVDYKIRSANHTKAYDGVRPESSGLSVSVEDRIYGVEIDLAENEMVKEDILRIIEDTDRLNDTGLNLQNTVESGLLPDEMVSADRELTDAVIREVREMAEWRLDSARTKAESEYEREHPLEDYKADNGIMILNRYFYGRVSYEVKFPDGWRGKTKQPRADAIQEYEDSDAHRRNMEQASGMNVYVDGRTKAQAETLRKIDGLANRLEQERMAGAVREMADRLHLDDVEVVTDASTLTGRRARAKGFYSPRTGKISIVIPNHASEADAVQTLLHEAVAHKGLRQLMGEHFDTFLWNVYRNADRDVRERINALASEKGWDFPTATEEYLASLAENTDFENAQRSGWWEKIKRLFIDMLHKMGLDRFSGVTLSDNELRYILWRSYENLREPGAERSITGVAADVVKQAELKVGNYAEEATGGNMAAERGKKEASETDSVLEREHQHTVISDATGTKILNNLDNLVKRYENSAQSEIKTFIGEVSKAIGARRHGSKSEYATFETKNGKIITIRLSDHNASTRNFDNAGRNNGISIVITARKNNGVTNDGNAHVVEFYYDAIKLRKTAGKPLAQIVRSIQQSLYSGEYHDTTGLAVRDEVNNDEDNLLFRDGSAAEDGTRDTPLSSPTIHAWDRLAQSLKFQLRETAVDYLTAIDKFQDLIAKHSGRNIESFENAYDWMTFLSSRNRVEMDMFDSSVVRPLNNAILKLIKNGGTKQPIIFPCVF